MPFSESKMGMLTNTTEIPSTQGADIEESKGALPSLSHLPSYVDPNTLAFGNQWDDKNNKVIDPRLVA
ncbi:hypothetical protein COB52_05460 [Candidatus Kaiserbacteria bacterium]|nr:MAG: hypothetical protein COB52_05460 [Candidatus Kaiserbacteria bacterium]